MNMATNKRRNKAAQKEPKKQEKKKKRDYHLVDDSQRELLVKTVNEGGISIRKAAMKLGINYSTAKHIMRTTEGTISTTPTDKKPQKPKPAPQSSEEGSIDSEEEEIKRKPLLGEKRKVTFEDENDDPIVHQ